MLMSDIYLTSGMVQSKMIEAYRRFGQKQDFFTTVLQMFKDGEYLNEKPMLSINNLWNDFTDEQFAELLSKLPINLTRIFKKDNIIPPDSDSLPTASDIFVHKHFNYMESTFHTHGSFETVFILNGTCILKLEKEEHILLGGEFFIIAPGTVHDLVIEDEKAIAITMPIKRSTFTNSFFNLLTQEDLLSHFFRTILFSKTSSSYLLFYTDNSKEIRSILRNLIIENYRDDFYFNNCSISWVNILFSTIMRHYSDTVKFNNYTASNTNFSVILKYIQLNYRSLTLDALANHFHYSEAYLSALIKKNTGENFTTLINRIKLTRALEYLNSTTSTLAEIAERVGYNSEDYFSRVFKKMYNESPQQYRKRLVQESY
jgi:AraC-like DNA-binding protein/mannose-6-phosphate isomerase-like protein (cupin superfamily)